MRSCLSAAYGRLTGLWPNPHAFLALVFLLAGVFAPHGAAAQELTLPQRLGSEIRSADLTGNWEFIPIPLPDRQVTHILVARDKTRLWIGTPSGVVSYDGVAAEAPTFESEEAQQSIYVNSMVEAGDGAVIVGTINDSLWLWKQGRIKAVYGACPRTSEGCPRAEWGLARSEKGVVYAVSTRMGPARADAIAALQRSVADLVVSVEVEASYLGFAGDELVAVSQYGRLSTIDQTTGAPKPGPHLSLDSGEFVRSVSFSPGMVLLSTDHKCAAVSLSQEMQPVLLASGNCTSAYLQRDGTAWLSTDTLYRYDQQGWAKWAPGAGGAIAATSIVEDGQANVWIGTSRGLWRYLDLSREHTFQPDPTSIVDIVGIPDGSVLIGLERGEVWRLDRELHSTRVNVPIGDNSPASSYFRGVLLAKAQDDGLWALTKAGLFQISDTNVRKVADYPVATTETHIVPSSLAVSSKGSVCVGLMWDTRILCLKGGTWQEAGNVLAHFGGSSAAAVGFDKAGDLVAVGTQSLTLLSAMEKQFGPFKPTPFGKNHLFGAFLEAKVDQAEAVAAGGWGGTVFLRRLANGTLDLIEPKRDSSDQPYLIRQMISHPQLGILAASDEGLYVWQGTVEAGQWRSLRELDPRLAGPLEGIASSKDRSFWISARGTATLFSLPKANPTINMERMPHSEIVASSAVTYRLSMPGLVGLPSLKTTTLTYSPDVPNAVRIVAGTSSRLDLSNLDDVTTYRLTATVTDGFLNSSEPANSQFTVRLPFYRNPYKLGGAILAVGAIGLAAVTRRGPTGFLLRRLGGLKWSTEKSDPRFAMEIADLSVDVVRYELEAPSALTVIRLAADLPSSELRAVPQEILPYLVGVAEGEVRQRGETFEDAMAQAAQALGETVLPNNLRFTTSQFDSGAFSLDLSKSLLWLPLELADDGGGDQLMMRYAVGRTVSSDKLVEANAPRASELRVTVFGPHMQLRNDQLPHVGDEVNSVAAAARGWGAKVNVLPPDASKELVLQALRSSHLFHYAGHAQFVDGDAGQSFLPIHNDKIVADEIATALSTGPHDLLLAFINGCGSSREDSWSRGTEVYGFASAFLNNAAYFVGAQWPIRDEFAASFAKEYYARLFPPAYDLWWRLLRRERLEGLPFAEALRLARHSVRELSPEAVQTWSSYIFYGDPTRKLILN